MRGQPRPFGLTFSEGSLGGACRSTLVKHTVEAMHGPRSEVQSTLDNKGSVRSGLFARRRGSLHHAIPMSYGAANRRK